jgi:hypothetical protein
MRFLMSQRILLLKYEPVMCIMQIRLPDMYKWQRVLIMQQGQGNVQWVMLHIMPIEDVQLPGRV